MINICIYISHNFKGTVLLQLAFKWVTSHIQQLQPKWHIEGERRQKSETWLQLHNRINMQFSIVEGGRHYLKSNLEADRFQASKNNNVWISSVCVGSQVPYTGRYIKKILQGMLHDIRTVKQKTSSTKAIF